jgi:cation:H+ antiporter
MPLPPQPPIDAATMRAWLDGLLFTASLGATLAAAALFARRLDRLGHRLGIAEPLLGLLTALAADAPELSSGATAIARGEHGVGVGVLLGSNMFNLAAMIGLTAIVGPRVRLGRAALVREGAVALFAVAAAGGVLAGALPAWVAAVMAAGVAVPYVGWLARGGHTAPPRPRRGVRATVTAWREAAARLPRSPSAAAQLVRLFAAELPAVVIIVLGSVGMVASATDLADRWGVSEAVVGLLVLATLTSLPNAYTAVRLGMVGRSSALVSETLNSNTINLVGGLIVPAMVVSLAAKGAGLDMLAVAGLTVATLALIGRPAGAGRTAGVTIVTAYVVYVSARLILA